MTQQSVKAHGPLVLVCRVLQAIAPEEISTHFVEIAETGTVQELLLYGVNTLWKV